MADFIDGLTHLEGLIHDKKIEGRVRYVGISAAFCKSCGDKIPEARRAALPGIKICVECAE